MAKTPYRVLAILSAIGLKQRKQFFLLKTFDRHLEGKESENGRVAFLQRVPVNLIKNTAEEKKTGSRRNFLDPSLKPKWLSLLVELVMRKIILEYHMYLAMKQCYLFQE